MTELTDLWIKFLKKDYLEFILNKCDSGNRMTIKRALSLPVFYNSFIWECIGNAATFPQNIHTFVISHNPKMPSKEELEELMGHGSEIATAYNFFSKVYNGSSEIIEITNQEKQALSKLSDVFKKYYLKNYLGLDNSLIESNLHKVFIWDVSPFREVTVRNLTKNIRLHSIKKLVFKEVKNIFFENKYHLFHTNTKVFIVGKIARENDDIKELKNVLPILAHEADKNVKFYEGQNGFKKYKRDIVHWLKEVNYDS